MTRENLIDLLSRSGNTVAAELSRALANGDVPETDQRAGRESAGTLRATFKIRRDAVANAGVAIAGMDDFLRALGRLDYNDIVEVFHFVAPETAYSIFIRESDDAMLGCIRLDRRARNATQ